MNRELSFHGGAGTVTGSRFLVTNGETRFLVDCGMFQGLKKLREMNWSRLRFDPGLVDFVLLTHAHIDHAGYLPKLVSRGFRGPISCTAATLDLARLLLLDAAKIQEEDAEFANRMGFSKHRPALPLYTAVEAEQAIALLQPVAYEQWLVPGAGMRSRFRNAGHILGAAAVEVEIENENENGGGGDPLRVVFSGDVGRYDVPLHSDPEPLPSCDVLLLESTYGDREHDSSPMEDQMEGALLPTLKGGGTVLIPSFAVGRSQLVTLLLRGLIEKGRIPDVPIHIDSPMAVDATRIYSEHIHDLSLDDSLTDDGRSRLFPRNVQFHRSVEESKKLNRLPGPRIIISASGMLTAGRVLHHLARLLPDPSNLVLLVGYQAAGTRGRAMLDGARTVRVHGADVPVKARFLSISGLSAHADRDELLRWVGTAPKPPGTIFITHGEPKASKALAELLRQKIGSQVIVPELYERFSLERVAARL
jgi:metallo-beta-lactamase family protein